MLSTLASTVNGLNTYAETQLGQSFKDYYAGQITWSANFKALWRAIRAEELIVRLGSLTNSGNVWGAFTADQTIVLDSVLSVHVLTTITNEITMTFVLSHENTSLTNSTVVVTIPAATTSGSVIPIGSATSIYNGVVSVTCTGGESSDDLEVWVAL